MEDGKVYQIPDLGPPVDTWCRRCLAGLVYGILSDASWLDACLYGSYCGGVAVTDFGCLTAEPKREEMLKLVEEAKTQVKQLR